MAKRKKSIKRASRAQILRALERQKKPKRQKRLRKKIYIQQNKISSREQALRVAKALDAWLRKN